MTAPNAPITGDTDPATLPPPKHPDWCDQDRCGEWERPSPEDDWEVGHRVWLPGPNGISAELTRYEGFYPNGDRWLRQPEIWLLTVEGERFDPPDLDAASAFLARCAERLRGAVAEWQEWTEQAAPSLAGSEDSGELASGGVVAPGSADDGA